ncbi:MAG: nucleotide exchange factor GrpE [Chloroflexota bacterium]
MSTQPTDALAAAEAKIAELEKALAEARERADRYHSNWQRSAADFQNWKRRTDQEKTELTRVAEGAVTFEMLRVLDDFDRAFMALPPELRTLTWIEGVYLIGQKLYSVLAARGLSPIEAQGQEFDPFLHEAVLRDEGAEGNDSLVVVQELQRGYRFHERVIRPTMVRVGPAPAATTTAEPTASPTESASGDDAAVIDAHASDVTASSDASERPGADEPVAS